jgi:hypothetical protein
VLLWTYLLYDLRLVRFSEAFLELVRVRRLTFGDVDEDSVDLENLVQVRLNAGPPFLDLVLVASDLDQECSVTTMSACDYVSQV